MRIFLILYWQSLGVSANSKPKGQGLTRLDLSMGFGVTMSVFSRLAREGCLSPSTAIRTAGPHTQPAHRKQAKLKKVEWETAVFDPSILTSRIRKSVPAFLWLVGPWSNSNQTLAGLLRQSGRNRDFLEAGVEVRGTAGQLTYPSNTDQNVQILIVRICQRWCKNKLVTENSIYPKNATYLVWITINSCLYRVPTIFICCKNFEQIDP